MATSRTPTMLEKFTRSPYLNLFSGIVLVLTAGTEVWETFDELHIGAHHGIVVFGLIQVIQSVPEVLHGLKEINEGEENFRGTS